MIYFDRKGVIAMTKDLLLEIGTEEIPAGYILPALGQLKNLTKEFFKEARIHHNEIFTYATPRRLTLFVKDVALKQADLVSEVIGPPKNVAFTIDEKPTKAGIGFAKSQDVKVEDLKFKETPKGIYTCALKTLTGKETKEVLPAILPKIIKSISFPKSMYWQDKDLYFARPIRWILALLGDTKIEFELSRIKSDNITYGHRFLSQKAIKINNPSEYEEKLKENFVIVDEAKRRKLILDEINLYCKNNNCIAPCCDELLDEIVYLVEYPSLIVGNFDKKYLQLPNEVLVSAMREHQRYFHLVDMENKFLPNFLVIANTNKKEALNTIRQGNERVLTARLEDADFFFNQDKKIPLEARVEEEKGRVWQEDLGTVYQKTHRIVKLAEFISQKIAKELTTKACRAALLCKADLSTEMVGEFPNLQGIMGYYYALASKEGEDVAKAIREHYLPTSADGVLPETILGSIVSIADKIDSIVSCFSIGLIPTGSEDPYALRRQAQGIINILCANFFKVPSSPKIPPLYLRESVTYSLNLLDKKVKQQKKVVIDEVLNFLNQRLQNTLINGIKSGSFSHPGIVTLSQAQALLAVEVDDIQELLQRALALSKFSKSAEFEPLTIAFKRVMNILKPVATANCQLVSERLLVEKDEKELFDVYLKIKEELKQFIEKREYEQYLFTLVRFRQPIDNFFDNVMVMVENNSLKSNRLALLSNIADLFLKIANFSYIENK